MSNLIIRRIIKVKKKRAEAIVPKVSTGNVGFDLATPATVTLLPRRVTKIDIGLAIADDMSFSVAPPYSAFVGKSAPVVPFFKIEGRSSLALKGIFPVGGIIDPSYRGEIGVLLYNSTDSEYKFEAGDRVAQLVCYHALAPLSNSEVAFEEVKDLVPSDRNDQGFGSTGL